MLPNAPSFSIPGDTTLEKVGVVIFIIVVGLGVYSKVTGKSFNLGLTGFSGTGSAKQPPPTVANQPIPPTIAQRTALANPAKVN